MSAIRIQQTTNYRLFERHSNENRPEDVKKHRKLLESMRLYGFLPYFPIVVERKGNHFVIKDGQHRAIFAEQLKQPIFYVVTEEDFSVAMINDGQKPWQVGDYAQTHAANGLKAYQEGMDFAKQHGLSLGMAFALLAGQTTFDNCREAFKDGSFKIKDRTWADSVAAVYGPLTALAPALKSSAFVGACMAICRVKEFDPKRLRENAPRCREKLVPYATREAYLDALEAVYNYGRKQLFALKVAATMALRERTLGGKLKKSSPHNGKKPDAA
jgi:hypothetical protein